MMGEGLSHTYMLADHILGKEGVMVHIIPYLKIHNIDLLPFMIDQPS